MQKLNAVNLKQTLWETLNEVKAKNLDPAIADSVASQAREILRTTKIQLTVLNQAKQNVTKELIEFAQPDFLGPMKSSPHRRLGRSATRGCQSGCL